MAKAPSELAMDGRYRNCGQLFRLPNAFVTSKSPLNGTALGVRVYREFEKIVFHGLLPSATLPAIESGGNIALRVGNTVTPPPASRMDTPTPPTQDKPRLELAEKLEADFYSQDIGFKSGSVSVKKICQTAIQITPADAESCPTDESRAAA